jgi:hypothetical protein
MIAWTFVSVTVVVSFVKLSSILIIVSLVRFKALSFCTSRIFLANDKGLKHLPLVTQPYTENKQKNNPRWLVSQGFLVFGVIGRLVTGCPLVGLTHSFSVSTLFLPT